MDKEARKHLNKILKYMQHDEKRHYEESRPDERKRHIYDSIKAVRKWLKQNP